MVKRRTSRKTTELTLELDRSSISRIMRNEDGREASFVVLGGIDVGNTIALRRDRTTVLGRDTECDGVIRDDGISRRHVEVTCVGDERYVVMDLGSTNGMFIDGQRIERHDLHDGDKILIGRRTILKFVLQDPIESEFQKQMYESSVRDALTGAFNRKHFDDRISSEISFARRHRVPLTLVMFDLDHFKKVNDTYGHLAGDQVLSGVVGVVLETLREEDILARYGGEEFAVIARGINDVGGLGLAERLRREVEDFVVTTPEGQRIPVTISLGVATIPGGDVVEVRDLVAAADKNLYKAKETGRNRVTASRIEGGR